MLSQLNPLKNDWVPSKCIKVIEKDAYIPMIVKRKAETAVVRSRRLGFAIQSSKA